MSRKSKALPLNRLSNRSSSGIFLKQTSDWEGGDSMIFPHRDDYYMFTVLTGGEAAVAVDFRDLTLLGGEGIVIVPGQVHYPKVSGTIPDAWSLFLSSEHVPESSRQLLERYSLANTPLKFDGDTLADLSALFEMLRRRSADTLFSRSVVAAIVSLFCGAVSPVESGAGNRYTALTLRFKSLLETNLAAEKRPAAYASMLNISGVYLNEAVKAVTGMSVSAFIRSRVVLGAKRLLAHTSRSVQEIAATLGYDDCSYFARLFRKETGMTPSDFRKNLV